MNEIVENISTQRKTKLGEQLLVPMKVTTNKKHVRTKANSPVIQDQIESSAPISEPHNDDMEIEVISENLPHLRTHSTHTNNHRC